MQVRYYKEYSSILGRRWNSSCMDMPGLCAW